MAAREPYLPPEKRITYSILRPANDVGQEFWRKATCEEMDCPAYLHGWTTTLELAAHAAQVHYIRCESGRSFTEEALRSHPPSVRFRFAAGQLCFRSSEHQLPIEREPLFVVRNGDSRAWTGGGRRHSSAENWRDDFGEHQQTLHDAAQKG